MAEYTTGVSNIAAEAVAPKTRITKVYYSRLYNLGDYQNEKIGIDAQVGDADEPAAVLEMLINWVEEQRESKIKREEEEHKRKDAEYELKRLEREEARLRRDADDLTERKQALVKSFPDHIFPYE